MKKTVQRSIIAVVVLSVLLGFGIAQAYASELKAKAGDGQVSLEWSPAATTQGLTGYNIYRGTSSGGSGAVQATDFPVTETSYVDKNVDNGTKYYYTVKPVYADGSEGAASNEVAATPGKPSKTIVLYIGNKYMTVNGVSVEIDAGRGTVPVVTNGRTLIPVRAIIEALGGTISWDGTAQKITIKLNSKTIEMWVGSKNTKVNGANKTTDVAPVVMNGRTMLPLRFITENLGCDVDWDGPTKRVTITIVEPVPTTTNPPASTEAEMIYTNGNVYGVQNGAKSPTYFTLTKTRHITKITTYHWNDAKGTTSPGKIGLIGPNGEVYGPWQAAGSPGQGGVPNAYWTVDVNLDLPAGKYEVTDSNPETWSQNSGSGSCGMVLVYATKETTTPATSGQWAGTWNTNWGTMVLTQNGNVVTGTYTHDSGRVSCTVSGDKLIGTWSEAPSYQPDSDAGDLELTLSSDGKSFTGNWRYGSSGGWSGSWTGSKL